MQIKENLKKCRERKGLSTLKLAKEISIDESVLRRIEKGQTRDPHISNIMKICAYFDVSMDDFVYKNLE
ncbi:MAG: helix-turn-helix transcriptional regulator [Clostridium sp.]